MRGWVLAGACGLLASAAWGCGLQTAGSGDAGTEDDGAATDAGAPSPDAPLDSPADAAPLDSPADAAPLVTTPCDNAALLAGCAAGPCTVSATGSPLASGASITVTAKPVTPDLDGDTLGSVLCSIQVPAGVTSLPNLELSIAQTKTPDAKAVLFQYVSPALSRLVATSQSAGNAVEGLVTAPGDFGATERPGLFELESAVGVGLNTSDDLAGLLLNLSSQPVSGAFYDGTHLFVCNGTRLLVYNGLPAGPGVRPDLVLGQPDLDTTAPQTTASLMGSTGCSGLWSDGTRLAAASGNRVLLWNTIPTVNAAPADVVLGQPDFSQNVPNNGGVSASSLAAAVSVDSDGTRFAVSEIRNNRVLVWNTFPRALNQAADLVIGQPDFTSNGAYDGATAIYQAWGSLFTGQGLFVSGQFSPGLVHVASGTVNNPASDFSVLASESRLVPADGLFTSGRVTRTPSGGIAVRDANEGRIAVLKALPTMPSNIDFVLGQPDPTRVVESPVSASVVATHLPEEGLGGGGVLLAPDGNRLLVFDKPPSYNFEPASRVVGQAGFTSN
ncbi:MAG: hypothetical protein JOZ69_00530, partial [Myxococcales bacterium]|nr:hypothetical protein [Myxococcales bacterium]